MFQPFFQQRSAAFSFCQRFCLACIGLLPCLASAFTPIPDVLVSATRSDQPGIQIPAAHYVLDRDHIAQSAARSLADLLDQQPGIHVADSGVAVRIDMRGFGNAAGSNVVVLLNGQKLNASTDSATLYLNQIDLDQVEQVEIIAGSAGTLYGNQAIGGLINIITQQPYQGSESQARIGLGSYLSQEVMAKHMTRLDNGLGLNLSVRQHTSDNYRDHNASDIRQLLTEVDYIQPNGSRSVLSLRYLDDFIESPGALLASELADDRRQVFMKYKNDFIDTQSHTLRFGTTQNLSSAWKLAAELTYQQDDSDSILSSRNYFGSKLTQDRETWSLNSRLTGQHQSVHYTLGMDTQQTDYLLVSSFGPQGNKQQILAGYAQAQIPLSQPLRATVGLRHAQVDNAINNGGSMVQLDDEMTVGSAGLDYQWSDAISTFIRADQNYRFAKVDEHTNVVFGQPAGIDNQRSLSYETGLRIITPSYRFQALAYRLNLTDEIAYNANTFSNINLDRSRRLGGLVSTEFMLHDQLEAGASWEYINTKVTDGPYQGKQVPLVPQNRGTLYMQYQPMDALQLRADLERVGEQILGGDYDNTGTRLADYTVLNLTANYDTANWRFSARINNLLNERYVETGASSWAGEGFNPAPERNLWLTASYFFDE